MTETELIKALVEYKEKMKIAVLEISIYDDNVYFVGRTNGVRVISLEEKLNGKN